MAQLDTRVQLLAVESHHPDLIAVAKQHSSDDHWYDDMLQGSGRQVMKRGARSQSKGGHSRGGHEHTGGGGGPTTVRARRAAPAEQCRTTVGGRTMHYALAAPSVSKRYERKEWHKACHMQRPFLTRQERRRREDEEASERALQRAEHGDDSDIESVLNHRKRDVVEASETRRIPLPGEMPCDSEVDPAVLASALPDDVLRTICDEHARMHAALWAGHDSVCRDKKASLPLTSARIVFNSVGEVDRPQRPFGWPRPRVGREQRNVLDARRTQWMREMQRK